MLLGMNPRVDTFFALVLLFILIGMTYPLWIRPIRRIIRSWKNELDEATDDVVDYKYNKRFKRKR